METPGLCGITAGAEGMINDSWSYDVYFMQGRNSSAEANENDYIPSRLAESLLLCPPGSSSVRAVSSHWLSPRRSKA